MLKSLTVTYSDDSIMMLVISFIIVHMVFYDYKMAKKPINYENMSKGVGSPISLNAMFFAAILLASRLYKMSQVFVLLF